MKTLLYYLNQKNETGDPQNNKKAVTVAVISDGVKFARGVALCSLRDQFKYKGYDGGRSRAIGRAVGALKKEKTSGKIRRNEAFEVLRSCTNEGIAVSELITHKSVFMPDLTEYETKRLERIPDFEDFEEYHGSLVQE